MDAYGTRSVGGRPKFRPAAPLEVSRTDFAAIESELGVIQQQLSRLLTSRQLAGTALGIIFRRMMG